MTDWLWSELHDLFDTDDGGLPEVRVNYMDAQATIKGFALLRTRAGWIVNKNPTIWSSADYVERPLDSVPNPAALIVSGEADNLHVVSGGMQTDGITIPDLDVSVFPDQLSLDYRMGTAWGATELRAFFSLLLELVALDQHASLSLEDGVVAEVADRFQRAWVRFVAERAA